MLRFYIHRKLHRGQQGIADRELLEQNGVLVVLAEPGAGKTDLLSYFSRCLGVPSERASLFVLRPPSEQKVLIVDALDELARIGEERVNEIIVNARASGASTVILASRSYVWDEARTAAVKDHFGLEPTILRLEPFDEDEQRQLFEHYLPCEHFDAFQQEVERFELTPILGNPQFLKLFADAYVEGGRRFSSKRQIYTDAVRRLASERRTAIGVTARPPIEAIVSAGSEIFAKLLLTGASGISASEEIGDDSYPYLRAISSDDELAEYALNTRLFKPTGRVNQHDPVHRIVAEYCAANYLVRRIEKPNSTLSLRRYLSIIAPNNTVRDELRGLLGWMASLGNRATQEAIIDLDPYTVFANGDAAQLHPSSKQRLLLGLKKLAEFDPFFRRMDSWRRFNVAGFFSPDMIEPVRSLLSPEHSRSHLRQLLVELLFRTDAATGLVPELRTILQDTTASHSERKQAYLNINAVPGTDHIDDFDVLVGQPDRDSLDITSKMVMDHGFSYFGGARILKMMKALSALYPDNDLRSFKIGSRYFVKELVSTFRLDELQFLLDGLTSDLECICGEAKPYRCRCRTGRSKIAGFLLDQYFTIFNGPHDPLQIGQWINRLSFQGRINDDRSASVKALSVDTCLRRTLQLAAVDGISDPEQLSEAMGRFYSSLTHAGLALRQGDYETLVDHAFATGNRALWQHLIVTHSPYNRDEGTNELRAKMRIQARTSHEWLRIWSRADRDYRMRLKREHMRLGRSQRYYDRVEADEKAKIAASFDEHRATIEAGRHWGWLQTFAQRTLHGPNECDLITIDTQVAETALRNCFDFVGPYAPSFKALAEESRSTVVMVLEAACLATFRNTRSLANTPINFLQAIKSGGIGGSGYREGEAEAFESHIDSLIFLSDEDRIEFLRRVIEPQLNGSSNDAVTNVSLLDRGTTFNSVKGRVALDFLSRYPSMPWHALETIFDVAATHADRADLNAVIQARCNHPVDATEGGINRHKFWLLRHFFFIVPTSDALWAEFSADPLAILQIEHRAGNLSRHSTRGWPQLNADQIYRVLDAFAAAWPKVPLPTSWGTGDPKEETAYRFLTEIVYSIARDDPSNSIPVFDRILSQEKFQDYHDTIKSLRAEATRRQSLSGFRAPGIAEINGLLENCGIASVEDMRALFVELLDEIQHRLKGAATNPVDVFYSGDKRVDENTARNRIVEMFENRLNALGLGVVIEHQMADASRCDITASTSIDGRQVVLVTEVKGQWNKELYTAASAQLADRYTIFPGAADQGIYLVLWFGGSVTIAGKRHPSIDSAEALRGEIISRMPDQLLSRIDVYILDVSRTKDRKKRAPKGKASPRPRPFTTPLETKTSKKWANSKVDSSSMKRTSTVKKERRPTNRTPPVKRAMSPTSKKSRGT